MAQLLVRGLSDETLARLRRRAKERNRSLEGEVRQILEDAALVNSREEFLRLIDISQAGLQGRRFEDSTPGIREDRER